MTSFFQLKLRSTDKVTLSLYEIFLQSLFTKFIEKKNITIFKMPHKKKRLTLLKSPHVNKKAMEQFELKIHKTLILIKSRINVNFFTKLCLLNRPKNIKISISFNIKRG
jgi:ribosomal protein S10